MAELFCTNHGGTGIKSQQPFWNLVEQENYKNLHQALKMSALFGSTYLFADMNVMKSKFRTRVEDKNLKE